MNKIVNIFSDMFKIKNPDIYCNWRDMDIDSLNVIAFLIELERQSVINWDEVDTTHAQFKNLNDIINFINSKR